MSAHQPKKIQKSGSQMLDHVPGPQPRANNHTAINIQQNAAKPPHFRTSNPARHTKKAPKQPNRPPRDLIRQKASSAREEEDIICCCCSLCMVCIYAFIGMALGCLTSSALCLCRYLNQTTLLGCLCCPFTMFATWWTGLINTTASVVGCLFGEIEGDMNMCSCSTGNVRLLDVCNLYFGTCCVNGGNDNLCATWEDCGCETCCEKDVLGEPLCKCCPNEEEEEEEKEKEEE